jgi:hypothetical protein
MIEVNENFKKANTELRAPNGGVITITPPIDSDYYIARVPLAKGQAIQIFPKFFSVGCGFAQEDDWNANLPLSCEAEEIYDHIKHNKAHKEITRAQCLEAIRELQSFAEENHLQGYNPRGKA